MSKAKKLIEECKQTLAEINSLIQALRSMPSEEAVKRLKSLPAKEKAVIADMIRHGETYQLIKSVREKNPTYIS